MSKAMFPMQDGPSITRELAEIIHTAYVKVHNKPTPLANIEDRGGFTWTEVSQVFAKLAQQDVHLRTKLIRAAHDPLEFRKMMQQTRHVRPPPPDPKPPAEAGDAPTVALDMPPLTVVTFKWFQAGYRAKYTAEHVNALANMVARHYKKPHRFVCVTDDPKDVNCETLPLWDDHANVPNVSGGHLPSCYRRLRLFDPKVACSLGHRIVSLDLDVVLLRDMSPLWDRPDTFVGWKVPGFIHQGVFNGSMFMFKAGTHGFIWSEFDPVRSPQEYKRAGYFGSDQGWLSYRLRLHRSGWDATDGVYSFPREVRMSGHVPRDARIIIFHGKRKPWDEHPAIHARWIRENWR